MSDRVRFGLATMLALVLLRLAIGWHFYSEGVHHVTERGWSLPFLKAAKGPLAEKYQSVLPDFHGWEAALHGPADEATLKTIAGAAATDKYLKELATHFSISEKQRKAEQSLLRWGARFHDDLAHYLERFRGHYQLADSELDQAEVILRRRQAQAMDWLGANFKSLDDHRHEWSRLEKARHETSADDVPFQKKRIGEKQSLLKKESAGWLAEVEAIEGAYHAELAGLLTPEQGARGPLPAADASLARMDCLLGYGIAAVGACLVLGLCARLAAFAGCAFLLSVVASQPFWVADAQPTFNQTVEMLALAVLMTVPVGRWGGLDFFLHYLSRRRK